MNQIKFENLPEAVLEVLNGLVELKELITQNSQPQTKSDVPITVKDVSEITGLKVNTLYCYCQRKEIPYHKKANRLFFFKSEIIEWIKTGRNKTLKEIEAEADNYLSNKKKTN